MSSPRSSPEIFLPAPLLSTVAVGDLKTELRMQDSASKTFVSSHDKVRFTVLDVFDTLDANNEPKIVEHRCSSNNAIQVISHPNPDARARIISIRANASTSPLNISFNLMSQIFFQYHLEEEFWEIVKCFGDSPHPAEGGCTHAFARTYPDGARSCCYDLQYMDDNKRLGENANPWSQRHTGIYHRRLPISNQTINSASGGRREFDLIVILHPSMETRFEKRIHGLGTLSRNGAPFGLAERSIAQRIQADPASIHELLLETYLSNWRLYLRSKGDDFQRRLDELFTLNQDIRTVDDESLGFVAVQRFRYLRDQILTAAAFCRGNEAVIKLLKDISTHSTSFSNQPSSASTTHKSHSSSQASTSALAERVRGYLSGLDALQNRIDNSIALLEYALGIKHQELAKESNRHMEELTHSTVDDSATVRTITVLGLVYLPGTFISGLFGMNFFNYNDDTRYLEIAPNFWIYVLLWLVFTGATYGLYVWAEVRRKSNIEEQGGVIEDKRLIPASIGRLNMRAKGLSNTFRSKETTSTGVGTTTGTRTGTNESGVMNGREKSLLPTTRPM